MFKTKLSTYISRDDVDITYFNLRVQRVDLVLFTVYLKFMLLQFM